MSKPERRRNKEGDVLLTPQDADLFFKLHRSLMFFVNERLQIVPNVGTPEQIPGVAA